MIKIEEFNIRKVLVAIFIVIAAVVAIKPIFAFSGSGNANWTGNQYDSYIKTTESIAFNRGILVRRLTNVDTGEKITVFCAEHTEDFVINTVNNGDYYIPTDSKLKKACKVAYFGWYSKYRDYAVDISIQADEKYNIRLDYAFTQQYIWEVLGQSNATFLDANIQNQYNSFKLDIEKKIKEIEKKPSFNGQTIELQAGESKVLTDAFGVLKDYCSIDNTNNGIRVTHNKGENTLMIEVSENCKIEKINMSEDIMKAWGMIKEETKNNDTTIYLSFKEGVQNQLYSMNYNSPVSFELNLEIETLGSLQLIKQDTEGKLIDGAVFQVAGPEDYNKEVIVKDGKIMLEKLKKGTYFIKEITAPKGYLIDSKTYTVEVESNKTTSQTIINEKPTGTLIIYKDIVLRENVDTSLVDISDFSSICFTLTAKEDIKDIADGSTIYKKGTEVKRCNLDKNGNLEITNLPIGVYELEEIKTINGVVLSNEKYEIKFTQNDLVTKVYEEIKNIKNDTTIVEFSKKDILGEEELKGAKLCVIDENNNVIDSWTSTGVTHKIEGLVSGKTYILREEIAPYGYEVSEDIEFTVTDDKDIQRVEMRDEPILKKIQIEKLDKETNEHIKSNNFSFGIFEDEQCTKLISRAEANKLEGTALFENLRYGTYFIKELEAPTGYGLSEKIIKIEIDDKGVYADGELLEENDEVCSLKFYNSLLPEVQTSDDSNLELWIFSAITSLAVICFIIIKMLKEKRNI